jgi:hypothetical protein
VTLADAIPNDSWYLIACAAGAVLLLLLLIARVRLHPALALAIAALTLGVASGMPLKQVPLSFTSGVGNLMGHIAILLGLGAVLGRLLAGSGGATALGSLLVEKCGPYGLPVFFEVGLVLLMPSWPKPRAAQANRPSSPECLCWPASPSSTARCRRIPPPCSPPCNTMPIWAAPFSGVWPSACPPRRSPDRDSAGS